MDPDDQKQIEERLNDLTDEVGNLYAAIDLTVEDLTLIIGNWGMTQEEKRGALMLVKRRLSHISFYAKGRKLPF